MNYHLEQNVHETVREIIKKNSDDRTGQILNILNDIQRVFRYLPEEALLLVSEKTGVPFARLYSLGAFFNDLSVEQIGKYILKVCDGTACHAEGAPRIIQTLEAKLGIKEGQTTPDGLVTLRKVHCVGACSQAPVVIAQEQTYGRVKINEAASIANKLFLDEKAE